jgi:hypothetical protein
LADDAFVTFAKGGLQKVATKAFDPFQGISKVEIKGGVGFCALFLFEDFKKKATGLLVIQRRVVELFPLAAEAE